MIHRALYNLWRSDNAIPDPGSGNTITISHQFATVPIVTAGAEARTLRQPTKAGHYCLVYVQSYGGDLTLTVTGGFDDAGQTTMIFGDVGDWVQFASIDEDGSYYWRVMNATAGVAEISAELSEVIAAVAFTVQIGTTDQVKFTNGTIEPITDNDIDLGTVGDQFKNAYFAGIVEATEFFYQDLVLNSTSEINIAIGGVSLLAIDDSGITGNAGITGAAGKDVFIETQDGGAVLTGNPGTDGAAYDFKTGDGSQGFETENENGADGGDITRTGGDGGRAGLLAAGTANGGDGASITDVAGDGGDGGVGSGNDGDGGSHALIVGSAGSGGGGTAGVDGVIRLSGTVAHKQGTPGTVTAAATLTVAEMLGGIITGTQSTGSTNNLQLPTGTAMQAALPATFAANDAFDITIINLSAALADSYTVTENTGSGDFTIVGNPIIESAHGDSEWSSSVTFRCRKTASNTFVAYRIS